MSEHVFTERDGKLEFVGDFDALYREEDDPWGQSSGKGDLSYYYLNSRHHLCSEINRLTRGYPVHGLEIGCGHGYVLSCLAGENSQWTGLDVSETAIAKARELNPKHTYLVGDIRDHDCVTEDREGRYDVVILSEILWYVLEHIDKAIANSAALCRPGGLLCVSQAFLKGEQRYGAEIANGFHGALKLFLERYPGLKLIEARYDDSNSLAHNHGLLIFRKKV
jgi:2-polyprenyl-3-methyl-5-hydroxy-6-metoxy-1,4-benzoquinol methylase